MDDLDYLCSTNARGALEQSQFNFKFDVSSINSLTSLMEKHEITQGGAQLTSTMEICGVEHGGPKLTSTKGKTWNMNQLCQKLRNDDINKKLQAIKVIGNISTDFEL